MTVVAVEGRSALQRHRHQCGQPERAWSRPQRAGMQSGVSTMVYSPLRCEMATAVVVRSLGAA
jgi:hypothetical protein